MDSSLAKTPLHAWHVAHGGRMVDFAGWSMPVQYTSIVAEHNATRNAAGLFDVSHMGRIEFNGPSAAAFLDTVVTRRITKPGQVEYALDMKPGQVRYALVTNEQGGILDDVLVYCLSSYRLAYGVVAPYFVMVVNASNRAKIMRWLTSRCAGYKTSFGSIEIDDVTNDFAMIAVQGPIALELTQPLVETDLNALKYYHAAETQIAGKTGIVSRTGYTGEDGCELILPSEIAAGVWEKILAAGKDRGVMGAGLGCRDTLRLEAGMPLYGHELNEQITPLEAGLDFAVNLEGRTFPGRDVLAQQKQTQLPKKRVGLQLDGKRVPREGYTVLQDGRPIGAVTSGTFSPTLDRPIAMAYIDSAAATPGTNLAIDIRGQAVPATVVPLPFYKRKK